MATEDRRLINRIRSGDKEAFEELVKRHYEDVFAYCYRRTGNREDAEDLTQEVFLKLVKAIYRYRHTGKFRNFIFTIAVNCCNDFIRRQKVGPEKEPDDAYLEAAVSGEMSPSEHMAKKEDRFILYDRLSGLKEEQKEALVLYYFHGFKAREIAEVTGVPLATAKTRIRQGLEHLKKEYEKDKDKHIERKGEVRNERKEK